MELFWNAWLLVMLKQSVYETLDEEVFEASCGG